MTNAQEIIARMLIRVCKIFNCQASLLRMNFKHSCDQVTFSMVLPKSYYSSGGSRSHPNVLSYRRSYTKK